MSLPPYKLSRHSNLSAGDAGRVVVIDFMSGKGPAKVVLFLNSKIASMETSI